METSLYIMATLPWQSTDAGEPRRYSPEDQRDIDRCLCCQFEADCCDRCDGFGHVRRRKGEVDLDMLRELLKLRICKKEAARRLGVSRWTLYKHMARMAEAGGDLGC